MTTTTPRWRNTLQAWGRVSMLFHWLTAAAFITAYVVVYYVIWFVDPQTSVQPPLFGVAPNADNVVPILNIHWVLGLTMGFLVLPRLLWRLAGPTPEPVPGSRLEHLAAEAAHWALYALLIVMPLSGYMTTYDPTDFGLFVVPRFEDTAFCHWLTTTFHLTWKDHIEGPAWAVHSFVGQWLGWTLVAVHVVAALFHHFIRRDAVLVRMARGRATR